MPISLQLLDLDFPNPQRIREDVERYDRKPDCTIGEYISNSLAHHGAVCEYEIAVRECMAEIRPLLPASEGVLTFALRHLAPADRVRHALGRLIGKRSGRETTGEVVIAGYGAGGGEIYGLR